MNNQKEITWDDIKAMNAESSKIIWEASQMMKENKEKEEKEREKREKERKEREAEREKERKEREAEKEKERKEREKERKERDKEIREMRRETKAFEKELERMYAESRRERKEMNRHLGGIDESNGIMAEQYFYNAFKRNKTFVNERFDNIQKNRVYKNGDKEAEFDIILFNGKSAALIEVKYSAKPDNIRVRDIISRVEVFKLLYPACKNHNIYLGVAAMSFRKGLEQRLHRHGIATIRQMGKKMVVYDKEVKVF
jgi:flagellar biosynthesis GTPase FlhF